MAERKDINKQNVDEESDIEVGPQKGGQFGQSRQDLQSGPNVGQGGQHKGGNLGQQKGGQSGGLGSEQRSGQFGQGMKKPGTEEDEES